MTQLDLFPRPMSHQPVLVGLCGAIGAGKDTVGKILQERHGFFVMSFATPLKQWVLQLFSELGMEERHVFGTQADKAEPIPGIVGPAGVPRTGREVLEIIGTQGGRAVMPSLWTALALHEAQRTINLGTPVVVTDARFATEFAGVRALGGVVWEVVKVGGEQCSTGHVSDREWRDLPKDGLVVARAGDLEALRLEVGQLLALGGRRHSELVNQA